MTIGDALFSMSGLRFLDAEIVRFIAIGSGDPPVIPQPDNTTIALRDKMTLIIEKICFTSQASDMN